MRIAIIDPFLEVSHAHWAKGIIEHSKYDVTLYNNNPKHWKWQMIGGTMEIAERIRFEMNRYDLLLVTDMLDLPTFKGYLYNEKIPPTIIYFHENQITYPWSSTDEDVQKNRDHHYGFINLRSAYIADHIVFNSDYHKNSLLTALPKFLNQFPAIKWPFTIDDLNLKASVIPIGLPQKLTLGPGKSNAPIFIWNHRWEYDKGPEKFFETLIELKKRKIEFGLMVLGKPYSKQPPIFEKAKKVLNDHIIHWGYLENKEEYTRKLTLANIALVTSDQDFFGISVVEAIQYGCFPLLPKRLAYSEHLPEGKSDIALYNEEELIHKLLDIIENKKYLNTDHYQTHISKYNWKKVIKSYDKLFDQIVSLNTSKVY